jgi:hypothetical protein
MCCSSALTQKMNSAAWRKGAGSVHARSMLVRSGLRCDLGNRLVWWRESRSDRSRRRQDVEVKSCPSPDSIEVCHQRFLAVCRPVGCWPGTGFEKFHRDVFRVDSIEGIKETLHL